MLYNAVAAETLLHVSGILALVSLGIVLRNNHTAISPEVEKFLHRCAAFVECPILMQLKYFYLSCVHIAMA